MKRADFEIIISLLLMVAVCVTGLLGYFQSELELRRFVPHRYAAYTTLILTAVHVSLKWEKIWRYIAGRGKVSRDDVNPNGL